MKTLLTLLVLFFSSSVLAEDISDFQIEGMSIGDSLLDYLSKDQILEEFEFTSSHYKHLNNPTKFREVYIFNGKNFKTYNDLSFFVKPDDYKYTIHMIRGLLSFEENLEECFKMKSEIIREIESIIPSYKDKIEDSTSSEQDPSGNSKAYHTGYILQNGDVFHINCNDWEESFRKKNNWTEGLTVAIYTNEVDKWLHDF
tara:strand:- start:116 stop:712 length:597 start_codon:yes stop_codon:yes gene_type:complete